MADFKYKEITANVIGAAMAVHNELGSGFPEMMYNRALAIEFEYRGIRFQREFYMQVCYRNKLIGRRRVDFFVEDKIMLEIKAVSKLDNGNFAQGKNYLEAYNVEIGLLINFGSMSLEFRRLQNDKFKPPEQNNIG